MRQSIRLVFLGFLLLGGGARGGLNGWRGDGTGRYPVTDPPTTWAPGTNVLWATALTNWSNSSVILSRGRLFVGAEPTTLVCVSAADGQVLWERPNSDVDAAAKMPPTHEVTGYSSTTPTTDGEGVYALFGNGLAVCYDFAGRRRWVKLVEKPTAGWGQSSSPLLMDGKLIVLVNSLFALNAATGEELWRAPSRQRWGTPVPVRAGNLELVVTPGGDVVRSADGKVLAAGISDLTYNAPIVDGNVVYFIQAGGKAVRLTPEGEGVRAEVLWVTKPKDDLYYASPVLHEGLIYAITQQSELSVIDAQTGAVVHQRKLPLEGTVYSSVTLAGGRLYLTSEAGTTVVLTCGREPQEIARNRLERLRSSPVFAEKRLYLRTLGRLFCIGQP